MKLTSHADFEFEEAPPKARTVYLAGPIRGNDNYRRDFAQWADTLRRRGFVVLNPAETADGYYDHPPAWYMALDFGLIAAADEVRLLTGWRRSAGCKAEVVYAQAIGKAVYEWRPTGFWRSVTLDLIATELVEVH